MRPTTCCLLILVAIVAAGWAGDAPPGDPAVKPSALAEARRGFKTRLLRKESAREPVPVPPAGVFSVVQYDAPPGKLAAYLTPDPKDGKKRPAIIWITGGDCNTIGDVWSPADPGDDQTAAAFRKAGIVQMFPSLRGGNQNPGFKESFLGEVDDVLAAADHLARQPFVDPARIYLGGHSTGGTLVLLVAECSPRFRAVFSFGPVHSPAAYPADYIVFDQANDQELVLRSPIAWLDAIRSPVYVIEGKTDGNLAALMAMKRKTGNRAIRFVALTGDHFDILAPTTKRIAEQILKDAGPTAAEFTFPQ